MAVAVAGVSSVLRPADASDATAASAAREVSELDRTLRKALVAADAETVGWVLAPTFELVDPSGERQTRREYLRAVSSRSLDYEAFDPTTPVEVRVSGEVAVVTYESQLQVAAGSTRLRHRAWHTHVYERADGRWRQVWSQATAVGGFPPGS
ncbi:hypothetical protein GCM10009845_24700 [Pedococcus bigeumensis]